MIISNPMLGCVIVCAGVDPAPVSNLQGTNVSPREIGLTRSSNDSESFKSLTTQDGAEKHQNDTTNSQRITMGDLKPGTNHSIEIFPQGPNGTEGPSQTVTSRTALSPVFDIEAVFVSPTNVVLTWKNDPAASEYMCTVKNQMEMDRMVTVRDQKVCNITGLSPATSYTFSIIPGTGNGTWGDPTVKNVTTEPYPVSDLRVAFMGVTQVVLIWSIDNGTASCRMLLESTGDQEGFIQALAVNVSELKPGFQKITWHPSGLDTNNTETSPVVSPAGPADLSSGQESQDTEVLLIGLEPDIQYRATVYSQAADGTEGQPQAIFFTTNSAQVYDIKVVNINATCMTLTWKIKNNGSSRIYTYEVHVAGGTNSFNLTVDQTPHVICGLRSSTLYNITVHPFLGDTEGTPDFLQVYTPPGPVSNFRVMNVTPREISLSWSSNDSESFRILTTQDGAGTHQNYTTNSQGITIGDLKPGTNYSFEIFPQGPNGTEGPSQTVTSRTDPSMVFDIHVVSVITTEMHLEWRNTDNSSDYIYQLVIQSEYGSNKMNSSEKAVILQNLIPGTLYNVTVFPEVDQVQGISDSIAQYTRPSSVFNIEVETNTTAAAIRWKSVDAAAPTYSYCVVVTQAGNASNTTQVITVMNVTFVTVTGLTSGSSYIVEIFAQVGANVKSLVPGWQSFCTAPAPVTSFQCEVVPKEPALILKWARPPGTNTGFELGVSSGTWDNMTRLESCALENGTECRTEVTCLNFSTSYNISIATLSCEKMAPPTQSTCTTGITDPPPPDGSPNITSVSHNSAKVKFSGFEASHGPIKAYAVILTTGGADHPSADVLKYTYDDFKQGTSDTYVTYLIRTEEKGRSRGLSEVLKYEIDVGNESTTLGYYNGKLEPRGSYRACVAGFTNITFISQNGGLINGAESYVSFSRYSNAVFLPQDPGVICGAVFGCIFGALVIVAVGGFIFWRKKRKDAKNNEVSFSQIKPKKSKLIRVENFEAYFKKQQADSNCGFAEEYEDLKLVGISLPKYAAELAENRGKNRYNNVLPYDISRVKLSIQIHSTDDYVNANYMPGYHSKKDFIATQGPLPNTLKDFWRMVWEKNVYAIVMLTKCVEQGRTKCEEYWPSKQAQDYGDITVAMTSEVVLPEWTIRDFTVKNIQTSESHPLRQFHFTSWPDHGVPDTTDLLINFRYLVRDYMKQSPPESPILVHCSAGVGRTGTFIAIDRLIYQIENENTVDVYGIVYDLRMHRPLMVQTEDQYVFLNQCVLDIIRSQKESKVDLIYQNTTAMTIYENLEPVSMFGKTNGYIA
uniref:Receptor-type tyrosine-protein phosphatase eta n=1 Tax=Castor canadensis TaxID=51338 RepID=A0A8B7TJ10_CASCN|nr:receptor-type tyrosine-protein phosphatase eta isoform X2 [Castor canadensis]XP_020007536.1 receptor-type tyrosine-protein phosphatase eta isoform X2 [Castor canadensis]XP_020007537.1 receptor-type tyrosine-protein phosphatase eta isoform X2 [Castor canadensis]XP_020007538.1 receptor-type tyrosine-protein phosphatase eta isoform X2 [Castor canadensis]XP_020007539.1 receptor-type tyrosine-protein phosphatase eta isoform X2 [Castor canadensis]